MPRLLGVVIRRTASWPIRVALIALAFIAAAPTDPAPLTDIETANMHALNLEVQRVNTLYELANAAKDKADHAAADASEHMAALKRELEGKRPGWTIDMATGKWTQIPKGK